MKQIKLVVLILTMIVINYTPLNAQDGSVCNDIISIEEDKISGTTNIGPKQLLIITDNSDPSSMIGIDMWSTSKLEGLVVFNVQIRGGGSCIDSRDPMTVLFRDGQRVELLNMDDFNCDPMFRYSFSSEYNNLEKLRLFTTNEVDAIRVNTWREVVDVEFNSFQSNSLMGLAGCVYDAVFE